MAGVPAGPSLRGRALLAVALTVAFYAMALAIGLGLIAAPIALWASEGRGNVWITIGMIGAGLAILRAIVPERARFEPPGPELTRDRHPKLHAVLDDVATRAGAEPAHEVYLDLEANASVLEHRGRRKMILGLPLMATLGQDELRAVIAHEYGHFVGGDTRFSSWIWRTRVAAMKAVEALATSDSWFRRNVIRWPFEAYARLFLRITNAISRREEFAADALAAKVAGASAAGSALRRINGVAPAWDMYWHSDVTPMLRAERLPPITRGFTAMTAHRDLSSQLDEVVKTDIEHREADPYASHPTLRQRLEALGAEVEGRMPDPPPDRAADLLADVDAAERELLEYRFGKELTEFPATGWDASGEVHLASLREMAADLGPVYDGVSLAGAGDVAASIASVRPALRDRLGPEDVEAPDEGVDALALQVLGACCVVAAADAGLAVTALPGEPVRVHAGDDVLEAFGLLADVASGESAPEAWRDHPVVAKAASAPLAVPQPAEQA
jgi:Zn-dependent protease with chaperone function